MQNPERKVKVLFFCTENSCRSQMAEGFLRNLGRNRFDVVSAGTEPAGLNPMAVEVMREVGIDLSSYYSKAIDAFLSEQFDDVITVCDRARESCPVFPGKHKALHWSFDDPAAAQGPPEQRLAVFRRVRNEIDGHVRGFVQQINEKE